MATTVDEALQERHQHQLRPRLGIWHPRRQHLAVLTPEPRERTQKSLPRQATVGKHKGAWLTLDAIFDATAQHTDDHLLVDRVGDAQRPIRRHEAQIAHIRNIIIIGRIARLGAPGEQWLDHTTHPRLHQLVHQRVQVRRPRQNQALFRLFHVLRRQRLARRNAHHLHHLAAERVHQPGLAARHLERSRQRLFLEHLPCIGRVLAIELSHLGLVEVAQLERGNLDVEGAGGAQSIRLSAARRLVVPHVAQAAEHHRRREGSRALGETRAELAKDADQARTTKGVDLVEEQHHRAGTGTRPGGQGVAQEPLTAFERNARRPQLDR